jgi:uncharacterized coiled-coil protein SlyX
MLLKRSDIDWRLSQLERVDSSLKDRIRNLEEEIAFNESSDIINASNWGSELEEEVAEIKNSIHSFQKRILLLMSVFCALTASTAGLCFYSMFF